MAIDYSTFQIRIGTMTKNSAVLSSTAINALSNTCQVVNDINDATLSNAGDIAIVSAAIAGNGSIVSRAVYCFDGNEWKPLSSKYTVDDVFFNEDLTLTQKFGKYDVPAAGYYTLPCKGQSIASVLIDAFQQVKHGYMSNPTFAFANTGSYSLTGEVGANYTIPGASLTMTSVGKHQYGTVAGGIAGANNNSGISVAIGQATIATPSATTTNSSAMTLNSQLTASQGSTYTYADSPSLYVFSAQATYTSSDVPFNNIHQPDQSNAIPSGTYTSQLTTTFSGKRFGFFGYRMGNDRLDLDNLSSNDIRDGINAITYNFTDGSWPTQFVVKNGSTQIVFAVPATVIGTNHQYIKMSNPTLGTYMFDNNGLARTANLSVAGQNGVAPIEYAIWTIDPPGEFVGGDYTYTLQYSDHQIQ